MQFRIQSESGEKTDKNQKYRFKPTNRMNSRFVGSNRSVRRFGSVRFTAGGFGFRFGSVHRRRLRFSVRFGSQKNVKLFTLVVSSRENDCRQRRRRRSARRRST